MLPEGIIAHRSTGRLRIRIPVRRKDRSFFQSVKDQFSRRNFDHVQVNPDTGSLLILGPQIDPEKIGAISEKEALFSLKIRADESEPLYKKVTSPVAQASDHFRQISQGQFDLPGLIFLMLTGSGIIQLLRGNFRLPPWYTAFWYAFGLFSKSLVEKSRNNKS